MAMAELKSNLEQHYYEITELYDLAAELIETVDSEFVAKSEQQFAIVEPLVEEIGEATDVLAEEFLLIAEAGTRKKRNLRKSKVEAAMRKIYAAMDEYHQRVTATLTESVTGFRNIADPIVKKIKRQMESIIAAFIEFIDLSFDRIMHKNELDELKQRQEKIANMLHQMGQAT